MPKTYFFRNLHWKLVAKKANLSKSLLKRHTFKNLGVLFFISIALIFNSKLLLWLAVFFIILAFIVINGNVHNLTKTMHLYKVKYSKSKQEQLAAKAFDLLVLAFLLLFLKFLNIDWYTIFGLNASSGLTSWMTAITIIMVSIIISMILAETAILTLYNILVQKKI